MGRRKIQDRKRILGFGRAVFLFSMLAVGFFLGACGQGEKAGLRQLTLADEVSRLPDAPGSYEWWNFYAFDSSGDLGLSMIFLSANLWDIGYRDAAYAYRENPEAVSRPVPADYFLLQLNISKGGVNIFSTMRNPPGTTAEFFPDEPRGRIGSSTFSGSLDNGLKVFQVRIDAPDLSNLLRLEAEVEFREASPGFTVDGPGLYGRIPGGELHQWEWPLGYPETGGTVKITDRAGAVILDRSFTGGGYTDHMWGEGLCGDMLDSWYFGRLDLGERGALVYVWLTPRSESTAPYGYVFRIRKGRPAEALEIEEFIGAEADRGSYGLDFFSLITMNLKGGGTVESRFGNPAGEDWPFQVAGPAAISARLPGDIEVTEQPGLGEYLWQPGIDSQEYRLMFSVLPGFPWYP
jgi:hypothetical protein